MRQIASPLLLLTGALLSGCGESSNRQAAEGTAPEKAASSTPTGGACALIDQAMADRVLGGAARGPIREGGAASMDQCQYIHDGERLTDVRTATVAILPHDLQTMRGSWGEFGTGAEDVPGVGEAAVWVPQMGTLNVARGSHTLTFSVTAPNIDAKAKSVELARAGLAKL